MEKSWKISVIKEGTQGHPVFLKICHFWLTLDFNSSHKLFACGVNAECNIVWCVYILAVFVVYVLFLFCIKKKYVSVRWSHQGILEATLVSISFCSRWWRIWFSDRCLFGIWSTIWLVYIGFASAAYAAQRHYAFALFWHLSPFLMSVLCHRFLALPEYCTDFDEISGRYSVPPSLKWLHFGQNCNTDKGAGYYRKIILNQHYRNQNGFNSQSGPKFVLGLLLCVLWD